MEILNLCISIMVSFSLADGAIGDRQESDAATVSAPVLVRTIPLPGVAGPIDRSGIRGRVDHLAYDAVAKRLFIACIANGSLEVVDLDQGKRIKSIAGLKKPQSVAIAREPALVIVSTGGDGMVHFFDTRSFQEKGHVIGWRGCGQHPYCSQRETLRRLRRR